MMMLKLFPICNSYYQSCTMSSGMKTRTILIRFVHPLHGSRSKKKQMQKKMMMKLKQTEGGCPRQPSGLL